MEEKKQLTGYPSIDKPWLKHFTDDELALDFTPMSMYQMILKNNDSYRDDIAITYFGTKITFGHLFVAIDQVAKAALHSGLQKNEIVMICLPNIPEVEYLVYALNKIGVISCIIDPRESPATIRKHCNETQARFMFCLDIMADQIYEAVVGTQVQNIVEISPFESIPPIIKFALKIKNRKTKTTPPNGVHIIRWKDYLKKGKQYSQQVPNVFEPGKCAIIVHTGGSTGSPKGVMLSNENCNALVYQLQFHSVGLKRGQRFLNIIPPFTAIGLIDSMHLATCVGINSILIPSLTPEEFPQHILKYKPNLLMAGPIHYASMIHSGKLEHTDLSFVELCMCGGDKLSESLQCEVLDFLEKHHSKSKLCIGYGATEMSSGLACTRNGCFKLESVGIPYNKNSVEVFDLDTGKRICGYGKRGELRVTGPTLMLGYFGDHSNETDDVISTDEDGIRWYHTGDVGHVDEDGFIWVDGRVKRIIVHKAYKIYPDRIEKMILQKPYIKECAVVGVPSSQLGDFIPVAYIIPDGDVTQDDAVRKNLEREINEEIATEIAAGAIMERFFYVEEFPLTPIGKLDFKKLEKIGAARIFQKEH